MSLPRVSVDLIERLGQQLEEGTISERDAIFLLLRADKGDADDPQAQAQARRTLMSWRSARADREAADQPVPTEWDTGS